MPVVLWVCITTVVYQRGIRGYSKAYKMCIGLNTFQGNEHEENYSSLTNLILFFTINENSTMLVIGKASKMPLMWEKNLVCSKFRYFKY